MKGKKHQPKTRQPKRPSASPHRRGSHGGHGRDRHRSSASEAGPAQPRGSRWVIGLHSAREALAVRPKDILAVHLREDWERSGDLSFFGEFATARGIKVEKKPVAALDRMGSGHQGVAVLVGTSPALEWASLELEGSQKIVILDGIQDPHNLGAILRTAWLMNARALILTDHRSASLTSTAMKVASGGAEHVPVVVENSLPLIITSLKEKGFWVYGLAAGGPQTVWEAKFPERVALVIGAEGKGLRITTERACDELLAIPQVAADASFNASAAFAIAISEVSRQHHFLARKP